MKFAPRQTAINEFEAADFNNSVALCRGQACCFGIEDDLAHRLLQFVYAEIGEIIRRLVTGIAIVPFHPHPLDIVALHGSVQRLPEILILDGFLVGRLPAALFPVRQPLVDAIHDVFRIDVQRDSAGTVERVQRLDRSRHFHAVIGRFMFPAVHRFAVLALDHQDAPATRARIAPAGAVCVNLNRFGQSGFVKLEWMVRPGPQRLLLCDSKPGAQASAY